MARTPAGFNLSDPNLYVAARRLLLDALDALSSHQDSLILVGAQAVHLRSQDGGLTPTAFTADADINIDPRSVGREPKLDEAMLAAGFHLADVHQPGIWERATAVGDMPNVPIRVDLLVPERFAGRGRRAATVPPHSRDALRRVEGLETSLVDNSPMIIASFEPRIDSRKCLVKVADVPSLLVAKAFKIRDRLADHREGREADKDAGDVIRLMQASSAREVSERLSALMQHPEIGDVTRTGVDLLRRQFSRERTPGTLMAKQALAGSMSPVLVERLAPAFISQMP